jgi:hypothetical protein
MKVLLQILLAAFLAQNPAGDQSATVSGTVVRSGSEGAPIAAAGVELNRPGFPAGTGYTASTGADGKFTFKNIPPGEYVLAATRQGHVRGEYGQRGPNSRGLPFTLTAGQELKDARIALPVAGALAGRVLDRKGSPFPYVQVQALRFTYRGTQRVLTPVRVATTNDLGDYRLFWLPPGQYAVMATPLRGNVPDQIINTTGSYTIVDSVMPPAGASIELVTEDATLPVFYPGTLNAQSATMLTVRSGEDIRGIDLTLAPTSTRKVRGTVLNIPPPQSAGPGITPTRINVRLIPRNPPGVTLASGPLFSGAALASPISGAFEISGVLPGSYDLAADTTSSNSSSATTMFGAVPLEVADKDIENVSVPLAAGFQVAMRVTIEGNLGNESNADLSRVQLGLTSTSIPRTVTGQPIPDQPLGSVMVRSILPGNYSVYWSQSGPPVGYVKSIRMDGVDVKSGVRLDGPPAGPIEVVLSTKFASITGSVISAAQQPLPGVTIVAVPVRAGSFANRTTDTQGRFNLSGLSPGDYRVLAFEDIENFAWQNAEFMRPYENLGRLVHVEEGGAESVQVTVIPATLR